MEDDYQGYNGYPDNGSNQTHDERKRRNYKLISDPMIEAGVAKVYRFDGIVPGDVDPEPIFLRDPRSRMKRWNKRLEPMDLLVPKFKYDNYYVGTILPKEVTFTNLNDNINHDFLRNMCACYGNIEEAKVYFHPKTKKHLGVGKVLFTSTRSARMCAERLNQTSKMGMIINAFVDPFGKERAKVVEEMTIDKAPAPLPPQTAPRPPTPPTPQKFDPRRRGSGGSKHHHHHHHSRSGHRGDMDEEYSHGNHRHSNKRDHHSSHDDSMSLDSLSFHGDVPHEPGLVGPVGVPLPPMPPMPPSVPAPPVPPLIDSVVPPPIPSLLDLPQPPIPPDVAESQRLGEDGFEPESRSRSSRRRSHGRHRDDRRRNRDRYESSRDDYEETRDIDYKSDRRYNDGSGGRRNDHYNDDRYQHDRSHSSRHDRREQRSSSRRREYDEESCDDERSRDSRDRHRKSSSRHHYRRQNDTGSENESAERHDRYDKSRRHRDDDYRRRPDDEQRQYDREYEERDNHEENNVHLDEHSVAHPMHERLDSEEAQEHSDTPPPEPDTPAAEDAPRLDLESRIASLLGGLAASPPHEEPAPEAPPLPSSPQHPEDAPPLPDEPAPPPLPPEPDDMFLNGSFDSRLAHFAKMHMPNGAGNEDDDRMSMSSIGSNEERIELPPTHMPPPGPPMPPMPPLLWPPGGGIMVTSGPASSVHNQAFHNNIYNQTGFPPGPGFLDPTQQALMQQQMSGLGFGGGLMPGPIFTEQDEQREQCFQDVLDKIISQLKLIMEKDLCKKMVQETAFRAYDEWLTEQTQRSERKEKELPFSGYVASSTSTATETAATSTTTSSVLSTTSGDTTTAISTATTTTTVTATTVNATVTTSLPTKPKPGAPLEGMGSALTALFERKDGAMGSAFGTGGLLGLSRGFPRMPSFKKKFIKPPTPPPEEPEEEEEEERDDFVGPRTPEQSDSEDEEDRMSVSDSELRVRETERRKKKPAIYSSDSGSEQEDESEEEGSGEEEEDEEDEDEEDDRAGSDSGSEGSDIDVEGSPSPVQKRLVRKQRQAVELLSGIHIEPATFPLGEGDEDSQDSQISQDSQLSQDEEEDDYERSESAISDLDKVDSDDGSQHTPVPSDMETSDIEVESTAEKRRRSHQAEEDAALALLRMHEVSAEERERQAQREAEISQARENVQREHCYMFKGEPRSRPRHPLPEQDDIPDSGEDMTDSASEGEPDMIPCLPAELTADHQYCALYHPIDYAEQYRKTREKFLGARLNLADYYSEEANHVEITDIAADVDISTGEVIKKYVNRIAKRSKGLSDITNLKGSRELASLLPEVEKPKAKFKTRSSMEQVQIVYEFLVKGIDQEDVNFLKRRYDELLQDDSPQTAWLNNVHWVDHTHTDIPDPPVKKRRKIEEELPKHETGCARTEGMYAITHAQKKTYLRHAIGVNAYNEDVSVESIVAKLEKGRKLKNQQARDSRSESRRWQTVLGNAGGDSDLVKFNQLKFRKKEVKFAKSGIHHWGLFALEHIEEDTMVIEYVGQKIRQTVADIRESHYEQQGIGSSYLFRIDSDDVVDATKCGSVARFINHSCNPNCYAKIITVEGEKKIVIYSKRDIYVNEEITYDYKFPLEDEKIPCLCGAVNCRGSLN